MLFWVDGLENLVVKLGDNFGEEASQGRKDKYWYSAEGWASNTVMVVL